MQGNLLEYSPQGNEKIFLWSTLELVINKLEIPEELKSETESQHEHQNLESEEDERKPETLETNETQKDQEFELGTNNNTTGLFLGVV